MGRRLKLRQRDDALARGIDLIEWTFDPLEIKNAYFNMERLGAIVRRYLRNQYGASSSPLHGGLPTDRLRGGVVDPGAASGRRRDVHRAHRCAWRILKRLAMRRVRLRISSRVAFARGLAVIGMERTIFVFARGGAREDRAGCAAAAAHAAGAFLRDQFQPDLRAANHDRRGGVRGAVGLGRDHGGRASFL